MNIIDVFRRSSVYEVFFFLLLFIFLLTYLILRAIFVPLVSDETLTFYNYIQSGSFIPYFSIWDANNHILNSFLSLLSVKLFGNTPFSLRLPNVLGFILFAYFVVLISSNLKNRWLGNIFILISLLTHNFIEFFNLCRGYGLSMALLVGSIFYALRFSQTKKVNDQILLIVFVILSLLSNLTLLNSCLILVGYSFLILLFRFNYYTLKQKIKLTICYLFFLISLGVLIGYLFELKKRGLLYYGSSDGFYQATLKSLSLLLFNIDLASVLWPVVGLFFAGIIVYFYQNKLNNLLQFRSLYFYLLAGNIFASCLLAFTINLNFPTGRTGLYLYHFFVGFIIFLADDLKFKIPTKLIYLFSFLVIGFLSYNFGTNLNFTHSSVWHYECLPYRFCDKIETYNKEHKAQSTISANWSHEGIWSYQNNSFDKNLNLICYKDYPSQKADFEIAQSENMPLNWKTIYDSIDFDRISSQYLLKRKFFLHRIPIDSVRVPIEFSTNQEFYNIKIDSVTKLSSKTLLFTYKGQIKFNENAPYQLDFIMNIKEEGEGNYTYERIPIPWHTGLEKNKWRTFEFNYYISNISPKAQKYITYIWNVNSKGYSIKDLSYTLSELKE